jgi:hypothetical protein
MAEEKVKLEQQDKSLEMRVAALEDKLAGYALSEDEVETYRKVMKVAHVLKTRRALRRLSRPASVFRAAESGCISGCVSPCDCSDCGCVEGCVEVRAESGCISGCVSPCDCSDCGCVEGCVEAPRARPRFSRTLRRFGSFGR